MWAVGFGVLHAVHALRDFAGGHIELNGAVTRKWFKTTGDYIPDSSMPVESTSYYVEVKETPSEVHEFIINRDIYNWLRKGDEIVVTYWRRTETVIRVDKHRGRSRPIVLYECPMCHKKLRSNPLRKHLDPQTRFTCRGVGQSGVPSRR